MGTLETLCRFSQPIIIDIDKYICWIYLKLDIRSTKRGIVALLALRLTLYLLTVAEILSLKHFGVTTLTILGHVTSSVTWPLEPHMVLSCWWSVDTKSLSRMVDEILCVIIGDMSYIALVFVLWRPALSASLSLSSASVTTLRWEPLNVHV